MCLTGRRTKLPAPRPDSEGLSLWNLLCKNIGKDLSQISMPVALNEPLNMLQVRGQTSTLAILSLPRSYSAEVYNHFFL